MQIFSLSLSAAFSLWFLLWFARADPSWVKSVVKTVSVGLLAVAVLQANGPVWLIAALVLGSIGDFFLSRPGSNPFLAGLISFALAHLAYVVLLLGSTGPANWLAISVVAVFGVIMAAFLWSRAGTMRLPVLIYIAIICVMGGTAFGLESGHTLGLWAALAFIASDTILSLELFVLPLDHPARRYTAYLVWGLYWAAQVGFAWVFALSAAF